MVSMLILTKFLCLFRTYSAQIIVLLSDSASMTANCQMNHTCGVLHSKTDQQMAKRSIVVMRFRGVITQLFTAIESFAVNSNYHERMTRNCFL